MTAPILGCDDLFAPGRLWSLWDMLKFAAVAFYDASLRLKTIEIILQGVEGRYEGGHREDLPDAPRRDIAKHLRELKDIVASINMTMTVRGIAPVLEAMEGNGSIGIGWSRHQLNGIVHRARDELMDVEAFVLDKSEQRYFDPKEPLFGAKFASDFQTDGVFELDEAAKCFALGRPTACVFHVMRLMEVALEAIRKCLAIPDPIKDAERNWGVILRKVKEAIDPPKGASPRTWSAPTEKALFEEIYVSLDAVRNAWRNATMHVEKKYTDEEAEHILIAARGFIKKVADRMNESGLPRA